MTASALLAWYDRERRELPWRSTAEPWAIWVSEVMLQQTRVETAVRYYQRFLDRFPTPAALATAPVDEALRLWSGLGYYRRCRQLHEAARRVVAAGGGLPRSAAALAELPGVGPYTAAAIASIAFGERVPVLDGNVVRVLARRLALALEAGRAADRRRLAAAAGELLDPRRPGDSNQALMELGALVCTPRAPRCEICPLATGCQARASGRPESFPAARPRPAPRRVAQVVAVVEHAGRWLFLRRPETKTVLPGLWELPTVEAGAESVEGALAVQFGGHWRVGQELARVRHTITTRRLEIRAHAAERSESGEVAEGWEAAWLAPAEALDFGLTGATRKLLALLVPGLPTR